MGNKITFITLPLPSGEEQRDSNMPEIAETYGVSPQPGLFRLVKNSNIILVNYNSVSCGTSTAELRHAGKVALSLLETYARSL